MTAPKCQMPGRDCPKFATREFPKGKWVCEPHWIVLVGLGMDDRRPVSVAHFPRPLGAA
jgi:hypothetical protein